MGHNEIWSTPPNSRARAPRGGSDQSEHARHGDHRLGHPRRAASPTARPDSSVEQAALELLPTVRGAFCLIFMDENTLYAARDPFGVRSTVAGSAGPRLGGRLETAAPDIVGASFVRDIEPGELLAIDADGVRSSRFANPDAEGLRLRVRLPRPARQHHRRPLRARARVDIGRRLAGRSRWTPTW